MSTTTLLLVVGGVVALKTLAFVWYTVRRGRRQQRELEAVAQVAAPRPVAPSAWRLQWAEPGVMLVENVCDGSGARDVELTATLTASSGAEASVARAVRFVATGACFEARFGGLEAWLTEAAAGAAAALRRDRDEARRTLASTLSYSLAWRTADGERRCESRGAHTVVPVPDLSLGTA